MNQITRIAIIASLKRKWVEDFGGMKATQTVDGYFMVGFIDNLLEGLINDEMIQKMASVEFDSSISQDKLTEGKQNVYNGVVDSRVVMQLPMSILEFVKREAIQILKDSNVTVDQSELYSFAVRQTDGNKIDFSLGGIQFHFQII